jgi:hypothetical protein
LIAKNNLDELNDVNNREPEGQDQEEQRIERNHLVMLKQIMQVIDKNRKLKNHLHTKNTEKHLFFQK